MSSSDKHILVFFAKENRYSIINDAKNKFKNSKSAVVNEQGKWVKGEILYQGTVLEFILKFFFILIF